MMIKMENVYKKSNDGIQQQSVDTRLNVSQHSR